jgi:hypothetical protein
LAILQELCVLWRGVVVVVVVYGLTALGFLLLSINTEIV